MCAQEGWSADHFSQKNFSCPCFVQLCMTHNCSAVVALLVDTLSSNPDQSSASLTRRTFLRRGAVPQTTIPIACMYANGVRLPIPPCSASSSSSSVMSWRMQCELRTGAQPGSPLGDLGVEVGAYCSADAVASHTVWRCQFQRTLRMAQPWN